MVKNLMTHPTKASVVGPVPIQRTGRVRLSKALLCPAGNSLQTVTLVNRDPWTIHLNGWKLMDANGRMEALDGLVLPAGDRLTVMVSGLGARFGDRGGAILLLDGTGQVVHIARYTRSMVVEGGETLL